MNSIPCVAQAGLKLLPGHPSPRFCDCRGVPGSSKLLVLLSVGTKAHRRSRSKPEDLWQKPLWVWGSFSHFASYTFFFFFPERSSLWFLDQLWWHRAVATAGDSVFTLRRCVNAPSPFLWVPSVRCMFYTRKVKTKISVHLKALAMVSETFGLRYPARPD